MGWAQRIGRLAAVIGGVGVAGSALGAGDTVTLSPAFTSGQEFKFNQRIMRTDTMRLPKMGEQVITIEQNNAWTGKVLSTDAKQTVLELKFTGTKVKLKESTTQNEAAGEPKTAMWDSTQNADDKDTTNPLLGAFKPFIGARFKMTIADGQIASVEQTDTFSIPMTKYAPFVRQALDTDQIRYRWQPLLGIKSKDAKASVGQEWTEVVSMPTPQVGVVTETTTRKLETMNDGMAAIAFKGALEIKPTKAEEAAPAKVKNSTISGTAMWDAKSNMPKSLEWKQVWTMELNAQGLQVERSSDWTMAFTRE